MDWWGISRNVFVLGLVSLFTDIASEMIYPLLPLFLANTLGVQKSVIGLIEGMAESTASLLKLFSGWLADRTGRYKLLVGLGYGASACSRPLYALVAGPWQVLALRFLDRVGKGIRTAPRDAIIAESAPPGLTGRAFGLQRSMDTVGAVLGPGLAVFLLSLFLGSCTYVFVAASVPGFIAVLLIILLVKDPKHEKQPGAELPHLRWSVFGRRFKLFVAASFVFALGNSSNAFLLLRAQGLGIAAHFVPVVYMGYNLVSALVALPAGMLSDRLGRPKLLMAGYVAFALIYLGFAVANRPWQAWALFAGYGLYAGLTEGIEKAWVKDIAPEEQRASAFGVFHCAVGLAALPASLLAGAIWDAWGPAAMFRVDSALACLAILLFLASLIGPKAPHPGLSTTPR
jgi:MFS family permease